MATRRDVLSTVTKQAISELKRCKKNRMLGSFRASDVRESKNDRGTDSDTKMLIPSMFSRNCQCKRFLLQTRPLCYKKKKKNRAATNEKRVEASNVAMGENGEKETSN